MSPMVAEKITLIKQWSKLNKTVITGNGAVY